MIDLIDTHSHIDVPDFDGDRDAAIERARALGVRRQIVPAYIAQAWNRVRDVCALHEGLYPAYGLHPVYLEHHEARHLEELREWIERERPVAVGECGLDHYVDDVDRERQRAVLDRQLEIAKDFDLPLVLHARRAVDEVGASLRRVGGLRGVVHSFAGSREQADTLFRMGLCIGIGGPVTYARATRLRAIVAAMPLELLLLETDTPDQPLSGHRGARNEPAHLVEVLRTVAALRGESEERIAEATTVNAERLFAL